MLHTVSSILGFILLVLIVFCCVVGKLGLHKHLHKNGKIDKAELEVGMQVRSDTMSTDPRVDKNNVAMLESNKSSDNMAVISADYDSDNDVDDDNTKNYDAALNVLLNAANENVLPTNTLDVNNNGGEGERASFVTDDGVPGKNVCISSLIYIISCLN